MQQDVQNPCVTMDFRRSGGFMLRARYYNCRIAVEFFHVLTDGTGGMMFLKTLVAEYLTLYYGASIPRDSEILDCDEEPKEEELVDGFLQYAREVSRSRKEEAAWRIPGTRTWHFMHVVTGIIPAEDVLKLAKSYEASVTEFLTAVMIDAILRVQKQLVPNRKRRKPVKICVPVNLRRYYGSVTTRNFASYANPGVDPRFGDYTLPEIIKIVKGYMAVELDEKLLNAKFSTNVHTERNMVLRLAPLFIKRQAMKLAFRFKGDRYTSSSLSNLGVVRLPEEMAQYVDRMDFMLGPLYRNRVTAASLSYKGMLYINFTRTIEEAEVERHFFKSLVQMGVPVRIESNENL